MDEAAPEDAGRRTAVLSSALRTFARHGYRATSMDAVAREARISRQGLYFLVGTKETLFREAVSAALAADLRAVEDLLAETSRPLHERLLAAYERWAGRWVGPLARDVPGVIDDNPDLLDAASHAAPARFQALVVAALAGRVADPDLVAQTLTSVSVGLKHQVDSPQAYLDRLGAALRLLVPPAPP